MTERILAFMLIALTGASCQHPRAAEHSMTAAKAEVLMAKIRPGMTLRVVCRTVPHTSERACIMSHGGLMYQLVLGADYSVVFRVSHGDPRRGSSDYERSILPNQAVVREYYWCYESDAEQQHAADGSQPSRSLAFRAFSAAGSHR